MIAFRAPLTLVAGIALSACLVAVALAQVPGPPLLLTPAPTSSTESAPADASAPRVEPADASAGPTIAVDALAPPKPDAMGLVDSRGGGFPDDMWRDSQAEPARALIGNLPARYPSPAVRRLAIRIRLSAAPPPATTGSAVPGGALLEARVGALAAAGAWEDALALAELVPIELRSPALSRLHLDAQLILGKTDAACGETKRALSLNQTPDPLWQKVQVLCQLAGGQGTGAGLAIDILREQGIDDPAFFWAVSVAQGGSAAPPAKTTGPIDPLILALLRQSGRMIPPELLAGDDPTTALVAAQIAATPTKTPPPDNDARLSALERAVESGLVDAKILRDAYMMADAGTPPASTAAIAMETPRQRAAVYKLAMAQGAPAARAEVISRAYVQSRPKDARDEGHVMLTGLVYAAAVREMNPEADLVWFAGTAVRILLIDSAAPPAGAQDARSLAQAWLDLAAGLAATAQEASAVNDTLWPIRQLVTGGTVVRDPLLMWAAADSDAAPDLAQGRRVLMLSLLSALGDGVTLADWEPLLAEQGQDQSPPVAAPSVIAWQSLTLASRGRRIGETVALALQMLDARRPPQATTYAKAVESLVAIGRAADARAVATDIALARGL